MSVAILASALALVLRALAQGAYGLALASHRLNAYTFASAKMADIELGLRQGLILTPDGQLTMGRDRFDWHIDITPADQPELALVTLTVNWRQGRHTYASSVTTVAPVAKGQP